MGRASSPRGSSTTTATSPRSPRCRPAIRERYRTAFQLAPEALIDAAARRQKWIDQSQSLNLFLARRT